MKKRNLGNENIVPLPAHSKNYKVNRMLHYILGNWEKTIELEDIAAWAGSTPQYASALLSRVMCMTIFEYLNALRINKAGDLLSETSLTVSEISDRCGFQNTSYFIRTFRNHSGRTPGEYRRQIRSVDCIDIDCINEA